MAETRLIDLTDLRAPVLTQLQRVALMATARRPVSLTPEAVLDAARRATGLSDFGAEDFLPRLAMWMQATEADANATPLARSNIFALAVRCATTRLRLEDFIARHPAVLDIQIDRPIIVAGLPRSGTTHMLGLLSADQRLRSIPWWEAIAPIPGPGDEPTAIDPNPRRTRAEANWRAYENLLPHMKLMHEFSADHVSEDIELQVLDFSSYMIEWLAYVPAWRDFYLARDQHASYAYLKRALQVLTYLKGPNRWVIKTPQHMEQLSTLRDTFPDATFVITHRDPVAAIRSAMAMALYSARIFRTRVDPAEPVAFWPDRYERILRACVRDRDSLPEAQTLDVYFHQWISHPEPILHEIYARAGMERTDTARTDVHAYLAQQRERSVQKLEYHLERDFGMSATDLRRRFGFYYDRFPVRQETA